MLRILRTQYPKEETIKKVYSKQDFNHKNE